MKRSLLDALAAVVGDICFRRDNSFPEPRLLSSWYQWGSSFPGEGLTVLAAEKAAVEAAKDVAPYDEQKPECRLALAAQKAAHAASAAISHEDDGERRALLLIKEASALASTVPVPARPY